MFALGVLGLTSYCRKKMTDSYDRAWKEAKRQRCRKSVTCEEVACEEAHNAAKDHQQTHEGNAPLDFSIELLNGPLEQAASILQCELVRLTWANRAVLKGRIVLLNPESKYLDSLLKRAAAEEVGGFAFCTKDDQPLDTDRIEVLLHRIRQAFEELPAKSIPPIWHVFGRDVSSLTTADGPRIIRITKIDDFTPTKDEMFYLPGAGVGHYEGTWVPDVVVQSLSKNDTMSTLNSLEGFWSWLNAEVSISECESKAEVAARMRNIDLYNETRYLY